MNGHLNHVSPDVNNKRNRYNSFFSTVGSHGKDLRCDIFGNHGKSGNHIEQRKYPKPYLLPLHNDHKYQDGFFHSDGVRIPKNTSTHFFFFFHTEKLFTCTENSKKTVKNICINYRPNQFALGRTARPDRVRIN